MMNFESMKRAANDVKQDSPFREELYRINSSDNIVAKPQSALKPQLPFMDKDAILKAYMEQKKAKADSNNAQVIDFSTP